MHTDEAPRTMSDTNDPTPADETDPSPGRRAGAADQDELTALVTGLAEGADALLPPPLAEEDLDLSDVIRVDDQGPVRKRARRRTDGDKRSLRGPSRRHRRRHRRRSQVPAVVAGVAVAALIIVAVALVLV